MGDSGLRQQRRGIDRTGLERLRLHGVPCGERGDESRFDAAYVVLVKDIEALAVYERTHHAWISADAVSGHTFADWTEHGWDRLTPRLRKVVRIAVRAAYALQMEEAVVWLMKNGGHPAVADIADPRSAGADYAHRWEKRLQLHRERPSAEGGSMHGLDAAAEVLLGADPEFVLADEDGRIIFAERMLPRRGMVGCDRIWMRDRWMYPLAELRPSPASEPEELFSAIRRALGRAEMLLRGRAAAWHAGGLPHPLLPLGGHLHFSGLACDGELLRVLDNYLALPLMMVEDEPSLRRRPVFGFLGDHRFKEHGGFEYRTLPSWLVHPQVASGVLGLAKIIAVHHAMLKLRPLQDVQRQRQFYAGDKGALAADVRRIWDDLVRTPSFARYRGMVEPLRRRSLLAQSWDSKRDLREVWNIAPGSQGGGVRAGGGSQKTSASGQFMV